MSKKRALHLFLKITFFFALYSFSLSPKHFLIIFSGKLTTKNGQKTSRKEENFFFLFFIIFLKFSLSPYGNKQNQLLFSPFLSSEIEKPKGKTSHKKFIFFFFFFFTFLHLTAPRNRENYHLPFFSKFRLKMPYNADKRAQVSFFTNYLFFHRDYPNTTPTHTHSVFPTHNV